MPIQTINTPGGETLVVLTLEEYEDLVDARDGNYAAWQLATGELDSLSEDEMAAQLSMPARLGFWRAHWRVDLETIATAVDVPVHRLAAIEDGSDGGDPATFARIAAYLDAITPSLAAKASGRTAGAEAAE
jgi:hypothetical protein